MKKPSLAIHSHFPKNPPSRYSPRKKPVQGRSQVTVDAILQAASQVLVALGYESANTTLIARKAGVSVGSLYQYFPNKDAVYSTLLQRELKEAERLMLEAVECQPNASLSKKIDDSIAALVSHKAKNPKLHSALKTELGRIDGSHAVKRIKQEALEMMETLLVAHGDELPLSDPQRSAFFVVNMVDGIVGAALLEGRAMLTETDFAQTLSTAVMGMLKTRRKQDGVPPI